LILAQFFGKIAPNVSCDSSMRQEIAGFPLFGLWKAGWKPKPEVHQEHFGRARKK
jgi:hypothetical protein